MLNRLFPLVAVALMVPAIAAAQYPAPEQGDFILKNFTLVLTPTYSSDFLLLPAPITVLVLTLWLLVKGVDVQKWEARIIAMRTIDRPSLT